MVELRHSAIFILVNSYSASGHAECASDAPDEVKFETLVLPRLDAKIIGFVNRRLGPTSLLQQKDDVKMHTWFQTPS
jgi:hypothetical protein